MEERTVAKLGRVEEAGETTLAAATAAIITARWGAPSRPQRTPVDDFVAMAGPGAGPGVSPAPASPVPLISIPESSVPFSPFTPVSPAGGPLAQPVSSAPPVSPAPPMSPAPPVSPAPSGGRVGGRASVSSVRRPPPPLGDLHGAGSDGLGGFGVEEKGYAANGHG